MKSNFKKFSMPFILFTKKQKIKFVNSVVDSVNFTLTSCGKKLPINKKLALRVRLLREVGVLNEE